MKTKQTLLTGLVLLSLPAAVQAQLNIAGGSFHIASGAVVAVRGDVTSNGTNITGGGTLLLNGTTPQSLGMGGGSVPVLQVNNNNDVTLASAVRIQDGLTLTAGDVVLGNNNLTFASTSASPTTYAANSALVTNGTGFVQKEGLANGAPFTFPVAAASGELTQAVLTNSAATRDFNVRVQTYAASAASEGNTPSGVNRTWQIYSSAAGNALVALQHEAGTEGATFNRNNAFVTRQTSTGVWTLGAGENARAPLYTHDSLLSVPAVADATSYFSKSDDQVNSLNPAGMIAVKVFLQGPYQGGGQMSNNVQAGTGSFSSCKMPTVDPYGLNTVYSQACNPAGPAGPVTDWVRADIYTVVGTTETLQQSRALLLQTDGDVVDMDGGIPTFRAQPGSISRVVIRHRNHLAVSSQNLPSQITDGATISYNFTTSLSQAYNNGGHNAQMIQNADGTYALFAGDINSNGFITNADLGALLANINTADVYTPTDLNLNGSVTNADLGALLGNLSLTLSSVTVDY